ncbi:MAG: hypothetical protein OHK0017_06180 [Patescibacteria group bacterium]
MTIPGVGECGGEEKCNILSSKLVLKYMFNFSTAQILNRTLLIIIGFVLVYVIIFPVAFWSVPYMAKERKDCLVANDGGRFWTACSDKKAANSFRYQLGEYLSVPYFEFFKNDIL